jgi:hypothetical protein
MLRSGTEVNFADIPYGNPNITQVVINCEYREYGNIEDML